MKFLLTALNAKYIHSNPALYSLRAYAAQQDELAGKRVPSAAQDVEIAEYTINQSVENIAASIYEKKPDVIAISCYIWNWRMVQELITILGVILPDVPLWLGGPEVSFHTEEILAAYPQLTGVMTGEGELTFFELLEYYREQYLADGGCGENGYGSRKSNTSANLHQIAGIVYRDPENKRICRSADRELTDISTLPFFYEDMADFENRIVYYESSRGCPYRCSYCLSSIDKKVRLRGLELVKKELQFFLDHKVAQVKFIDRTFNCDHEHALAVWRYIREHDNGVTNFHFEVAAGILTEEELKELAQMRAGLVQLEISVQTTNLQTLKEIRRYEDLDKLQNVTARLKAGGNIHVHLDLIAGLPFEDLESFQNSFNDVYRMRPSQLQLGFLKVLKGSHMEEMAQEYGLVYRQEPPYEVLYTNWISYSQLRLLKGVEEMVELFYNSGQFTHTIPVLETCFKAPFDLYEALAAFYKENGYAVSQPSRMEKYRVLLAFAMQTDGSRESLWKELLTYDLYLRENCKSRPEFAASQEAYKAWIQAFYQKEEQERQFLDGYESYDSRQLQRMTHMEVFGWPVHLPAQELLEFEASAGQSMAEDGCTAVLFDYQKRSPLDGNAAVYPFAVTKADRRKQQ